MGNLDRKMLLKSGTLPLGTQQFYPGLVHQMLTTLMLLGLFLIMKSFSPLDLVQKQQLAFGRLRSIMDFEKSMNGQRVKSGQEVPLLPKTMWTVSNFDL